MNIFRRESAPVVVLLAGFALWSTVFVLLYAAQATGCRLGWHMIGIFGAITLQRAALVLLFLGAILLHIALYRFVQKRTPSGEERWSVFSGKAGAQLALAAFGATLFCFSGVFWLSAC